MRQKTLSMPDQISETKYAVRIRGNVSMIRSIVMR